MGYYGKVFMRDISSDNPNEIISNRRIKVKKNEVLIVYPGYTIIDDRLYYTCSKEDTKSFFMVNRNYIKLTKNRPEISESRINAFIKGYSPISNVYEDINNMINTAKEFQYKKTKSGITYDKYQALLSQVSEDDIESYHTFYKRLIDIRSAMKEILCDIERLEGNG